MAEAKKRAPKAELAKKDGESNAADTTAKDQRAAHLKKFAFKKGQSGNPKGRPEGSKNRLQEGFLRELADDFQVHGAAAIVAMREERPGDYIRVVAGLMPKDANFNMKADEAFVKLWEMVSAGSVAALLDHLDDDDNDGAVH